MDSISNFLITLVNAQKVGKKRIAVPHSKFKEQLARFLQEKGFVTRCRVQAETRPKLIITLAYHESGQPLISSAKRLSKSGRRLYIKSRQLPYTGRRPGVYIVSTAQGLKDQKEARAKQLGGELVGVVWQ